MAAAGLPILHDACDLDFLALGALVHRLDPGLVPFRKARSFDVHVSGGEYNVAAGLADILAGDNHGDDRTIATGADFLRAQEGETQAELLTVLNPGAILRDEPLGDVPPLVIRRTWMQRIRRMLGGAS